MKTNRFGCRILYPAGSRCIFRLSVLLMFVLVLGFPNHVDAAQLRANTNQPQPRLAGDSPVYLPLLLKNAPGAAAPCAIGGTLQDPANDVGAPHVDVTAVTSKLSGETLTATFFMRDVPATLTFDRYSILLDKLEYQWAVYIDVDDNPLTGFPFAPNKGADYSMSIMHFVFTPDSPLDLPISDGVQVNTWKFNPTTNGWNTVSQAALVVDPVKNTMTVSDIVPNVTTMSRIMFYTFDYNPGGTALKDTSSCNRE